LNSYGKRILAVTGTGSFLSVINSSSLLIAIPAIIRSLHVSFFMAIWIIVVYSLALTVLTPVLGKYSDIIGRKRLYSSGYIVFFIGSLISSIATGGDVLLAGRVVQGIGGALLFSNSLAILTDSFDAAELGEAMGINAAIVALGTSIGPLVGGLLTEFNWRYIFVFNMPIAIYGFIASTVTIREIPRKISAHIDVRGAVLLSLTIVVAIVLMTVLPGISLRSLVFISLLVALVLFLSLFLYQESLSRRPIIDPTLFRINAFRDSIIALVGGSIARFSVLFLLILFLQGPLEKDPLAAGVLVIPFAGAMGIFSFLSGYIKGKLSPSGMESLGLMLSGLGALLLAAVAFRASDYALLGMAMAVAGAGSGLFYTPNSTVTMLSVPPEKRGETAGVRTLMLNFGSVLGLTIVFMVISAYVPGSIVDSIFLGITTPAVENFTGAFIHATQIAFIIAAVFSLIPVPLVMRSRLKRKLSDRR
jgi:MFS family permease